MNDSKKIRNNLILGILGQVVALALGVVVPKLILDNYGSEVNGLLSSVTNIYAYIAIVEAGVAAASCQALYKTIANKDKAGTSAVLAATNKYYHRTGVIYFGLIALFSILYPILISSSIPYTTIVWVILFNGLGNIINYFFHGKYLILLKADGKNYIRTGLEMFTNAFKQISKIVLIALGLVLIIVGVSFCLKIETEAGKYECKYCGHRYIPKYSSVYFAMHLGRTRYMTCPKCHKKSWQKKIA